MGQAAARRDVIQQLQKDINALQQPLRSSCKRIDTGLASIEKAFPGQRFPTGAIHEFISYEAADAAATNAFISGLLGRLMQQKGMCLWISNRRTVFPTALKFFSLKPEHIIFIDLSTQKDVLWATEEALKCEALAAVVCELGELTFTQSRRLQLAVEESHVTGFIHRYKPKAENIVACVTRWKIKPLPSMQINNMPGPGFARWQVQLQKVRNGKPGTWIVEWQGNKFSHVRKDLFTIATKQNRKTG